LALQDAVPFVTAGQSPSTQQLVEAMQPVPQRLKPLVQLKSHAAA
jgi:hypothetical protein